MKTISRVDASGAARAGKTSAVAGPLVCLSRKTLLLTLIVALALAIAASICLGSAPSSLAQAFHAIFTPSGTDMDVTIRDIRVPRTLSGIIVGACLGVAGLLVQGHTRNPIADPGLLGINQGAALAIVALITIAGSPSYLTQALVAFLGALTASILVFLIGSASKNGATPMTLVLAGAAVTALCAGLVSAIVLLNEEALDTLRFWQIGSLAGRNDVIGYIWPFITVGMAISLWNSGALNALALGEESARSLGVSVFRARAVGVLAITLLAGSAVTLAGPIAFAGLIVPHIARFLAGVDYRWLMPTSALIGAVLVVLADTVGRVVARPGELSAGVMLAVLGAPFFVMLARRRRLVQL